MLSGGSAGWGSPALGAGEAGSEASGLRSSRALPVLNPVLVVWWGMGCFPDGTASCVVREKCRLLGAQLGWWRGAGGLPRSFS